MMNKWWIFTLILMVCLTGCNNGLVGERTDDQSAIEMQHNYSAEDIYIQDIKLVDFMKLNKEQALDRLGGEYEIVSFSDGYDEGYYFPKYFLTVAFDRQGLPDTIVGSRGVDLMGLKMDMGASEVKKTMGEGELRDLENVNLPFALIYRYDEGFAIWFYLTEEKGDVFGIDVYFFR